MRSETTLNLRARLPRCGRRWARALPAALAPLLLLAAATPVQAQGPGGPPGEGPPPGGPGPFEREVFPPHLVMAHQSEIGLEERQKEAIVREMQRTQSDLVPLQFAMSEAAEKLNRALAGARVDEGEALALAERVMSLESQVKRTHLGLLIRIKNLLTEEQQEKLRDLRAEDPGRPGLRRRGPAGIRGPGGRPRGPGQGPGRGPGAIYR